MSVLLEPILSEAREAAVQEARREAESSAIMAVKQEDPSAHKDERTDGMMYNVHV